MGLTVVTEQQCIKFKLHFESHSLPQKSLLLGLDVRAGQLPAESMPGSLGGNQQWGRTRVSPWQPGKGNWDPWAQLGAWDPLVLQRSLCLGLHLSTSMSDVTGMADGAWTPESPRYELQSWLCNHELRDLEKFTLPLWTLVYLSKMFWNRHKFIGFCHEGEIRSYHCYVLGMK